MTKPEARKVFRSSYLYWHGKGRCWDASPHVSHRHQKVRAVRRHHVGASHDIKAKPKPEETPKAVNAGSMPTQAERTLTPDDLRKFANSMAAMPAEPVLTKSWTAGPMKSCRSTGPSRRWLKYHH